VYHPGEKENALCRCSFAGIDVSDNTDIPDFLYVCLIH